MAKQTFTTGQVLTAAQVNSLQANDFNQTVSVKTANYTLAAADKGTRIEFNTSGSVTCTVNSGLFDAGDTLVIQNRGAGTATITAGTATVNTSASLALAQYSAGTLYFVSDSAALFFGDAAGISASIVDAKGDLIVGTADNTVARLAVGTNGHTLVAKSSEATGLAWEAPAAGGGMTLLSTTTLSGTSTTISGISTAYKNLQIVVQLVSLSNAGTYNIQPNASATNCVFVGQYFFGPSTTGVSSSAGGAPAQSSNFLTSNTDNSFSMNIYDYASASNRKSFDFQGYYYNASNVYCAEQAHGGIKTTSAITSLKIEASLGYSFNSGTVLLYGVQ